MDWDLVRERFTRRRAGVGSQHTGWERCCSSRPVRRREPLWHRLPHHRHARPRARPCERRWRVGDASPACRAGDASGHAKTVRTQPWLREWRRPGRAIWHPRSPGGADHGGCARPRLRPSWERPWSVRFSLRHRCVAADCARRDAHRCGDRGVVAVARRRRPDPCRAGGRRAARRGWRGLANVTRRGRPTDDPAVLAALTHLPRPYGCSSWLVVNLAASGVAVPRCVRPSMTPVVVTFDPDVGLIAPEPDLRPPAD